MLVKTNRCFYDLKDDVYRHEGDEFIVNEDRFKDLNEKVPGFVEEVEEKAPSKPATKKEEKKTSKK